MARATCHVLCGRYVDGECHIADQRAYGAAYRAAHRDELKAKYAAWRAAHRGYTRAYRARPGVVDRENTRRWMRRLEEGMARKEALIEQLEASLAAGAA